MGFLNSDYPDRFFYDFSTLDIDPNNPVGVYTNEFSVVVNYNGIDIPAQSIRLPDGTVFNSSEVATLMAQNPNFQYDDYSFIGSSGDDFVNHSANYVLQYHWTPGTDHFINTETVGMVCSR